MKLESMKIELLVHVYKYIYMYMYNFCSCYILLPKNVSKQVLTGLSNCPALDKELRDPGCCLESLSLSSKF